MLYYKKEQMKAANKAGKRLWYPVVVSRRGVIPTRKIAREVSERSGATEGDVIGILRDLGRVMCEHLSEGDRVMLDGIGSFKLSARAKGEGVEQADQVSAKQFNQLSIIFTPEAEVSRTLGTKSITLIAPELVKFAPIESVSASLRSDKKAEKPETGGGSGGNSTPPGGSGFDGH